MLTVYICPLRCPAYLPSAPLHRSLCTVSQRSQGGKTFAAANVCPHIGTPLDQGTVENGAIICPLHRSAFDLRTGKLVGPWCPAPPLIGPLTGTLKSPKELQTFQCRQQGGKVQVLLDVNAKKRFETTFWRGILDAQGKVDGGYY